MSLISRLTLLGLFLSQPAFAQTAADQFAPKRGINLEIWNEWLTADEMVSRPGFLDIYPDWRSRVQPGMIESLSAQGFDFVRIPFDPAPLLRLGPGPEQDALIAQIAATAREVQAKGLKVIVDMHSIPRETESWGTDDIVGDPALFEAHLALVAKVGAAINGMDPTRTAFELLNEPTSDCDALNGERPMTWPDQLVRLHTAARKAAPELPLILSGACWGGVNGLAAINPTLIADDNVLWSFHSYDPFLFTHQAASWTGGIIGFFADIPYPPSSLDDDMAASLAGDAETRVRDGFITSKTPVTRADLDAEMAAYRALPADAVRAELDEAAAWADAHGIPRNRLIMGEFGAIREDVEGRQFMGTNRTGFISDKRLAAEELGIGWAVWVWSGSFGIVEDDQTRQIMPDMCAALGLTGCE
jgi:endoglucanase